MLLLKGEKKGMYQFDSLASEDCFAHMQQLREISTMHLSLQKFSPVSLSIGSVLVHERAFLQVK